MRELFRALTAVALVFSCAAAAQAALLAQYNLQDHPDAAEDPPPYGLRFDDIYTTIGGPAGVTTFSFNTFNNVLLDVNDTGGGNLNLHIYGTVFGGVDVGGVTGFGAGAYTMDINYNFNVGPSGTGYTVNPPAAGNVGTLTSLGNPDVAAGVTFNFSDKDMGDGNSFLFLQDDHRLAGYPQAGQGFWVGRGWFKMSPDVGGTHDLLFIGKPVPEPTLAGLAAVGGLLLARRRRA